MTSTEPEDPTVAAVGMLSAAFEGVERARGHLYSFHQLTGAAHNCLRDAIDALKAAGHDDLARRLTAELLARDVIPGRWTYQIMEEYEDTYYSVFRSFVEEGTALTGGVRHGHERNMQRDWRRMAAEAAREREPSLADGRRHGQIGW